MSLLRLRLRFVLQRAFVFGWICGAKWSIAFGRCRISSLRVLLRAVSALCLATPQGEALSGTYTIVGESTFSADAPLPVVNAFMATRDGGYLLVGSALPRQIWIVKTDVKGIKQWERIVDGRASSYQSAMFALELDDGFMVFGRGNADEFTNGDAQSPRNRHPFAMKVSKDGSVEWRKGIRSRDGRVPTNLACGVAVRDGYVIAGSSVKGRGVSAAVPWFAKLDQAGAVVWELFQEGSATEHYSANGLGGPKHCGGALFVAGGLATFALDIRLSDARSPESSARKATFSTLLVQLDELGKIRSHSVVSGGIGGALFAAETGFTLIDRFGQSQGLAIRRTLLNEDLSIQKQIETRSKGVFFVPIGTVGARDATGFHFLGSYADDLNGPWQFAIAHFADDQGFSPAQVLVKHSLSQSGAAIVRSYQGELGVLLLTESGVKLLRLRYGE